MVERRPMRDPILGPVYGDEIRAVMAEVRRSAPMLVFFGLLFNVLFLASPLFTMQVYDRVLSTGHVETLLLLIVVAAVAMIFMGIVEIVRSMMLSRASAWFERRLAPSVIKASFRSKLLGLGLNAQPLRELATVRQFLGSQAINVISDIPWAPVYIFVIWIIHPWLGVMALCSAGLLLALAYGNNRVSREGLKEASRLSNGSFQKADLAVRNADVFHALGMVPDFLKGWSGNNDQAVVGQLQAARQNAVFYGVTKAARLLIQIAVLGLGAYLVIQDDLTGGGMMAASILLARGLSPVEQAIGSWRSYRSARDAYDRLLALLDRIPQPPAMMLLPPPRGHVSCEQVSYTVRNRTEPVLNAVSFRLEAGEALGIIGPSASGKSSLSRILVGTLRPSSGQARLDGADLFAWPSEQLGHYVGYLPQSVELFDGTVSSNIARLAPDFDPSAVVEAAMMAGVHEMILRLPNGYETDIGEGGAFLSGGQRQRIGLARALFNRPKLIVLDEPNANLDADGEAAVIQSVEKAKSWGATVVIVAHQPYMFKAVDKLMVLREGRVEMFGPREAIMEKMRGPAVRARPVPATDGISRQSRPESGRAEPRVVEA